MRFECRIPKATDTHSEYVILTAFPLKHGSKIANQRPPLFAFTELSFCKQLTVHPLEQFLETGPKENVFRRVSE